MRVRLAKLGIAPDGLRIKQSTDPARDPGCVGKSIELAPEEDVLLDPDWG